MIIPTPTAWDIQEDSAATWVSVRED